MNRGAVRRKPTDFCTTGLTAKRSQGKEEAMERNLQEMPLRTQTSAVGLLQ